MGAQNLKICIVDDERDLLDGYLSALAGAYDVSAFDSGGAILEAMDQGLNPQIIVSDLRMPKMNGFEVVENIKKRGHPCKMIISSGHADKSAAIQALNLGVNGFLEKPHTIRQFKEMLARVESQMPEKLAPTYLIHDLFDLLLIYYNRITAAENELTRLAIPYPTSPEGKLEYVQWLRIERELRNKIEEALGALDIKSEST